MAMKPVKPVRHLVLPRVRAQTASTTSDGDSDPDTATLAPGEVQLHAFYKPPLEAGTYTIKVEQTVSESNGTKHLMSGTANFPPPQAFEVVAPQFAIDPKDIHSTYPPQGHADQPSVLPHIVFNNPHLPWERDPLKAHNPLDDKSPGSFPWLAVLPFDCKSPNNPELVIPQDLLKKGFPLYKSDTSTSTPTIIQSGQSSTFAISMHLSEYLALNATTTKSSGPIVFTPIWNNENNKHNIDDDESIPVDVIFLNVSLFKQLFPPIKNAPGAVAGNNPTTDLTDYHYCCHVRNINTSGMAGAGVEDTGLFSIVHSLRTGPLDIQQGTPPRSQAVHLITLECLDMIDLTNAKDSDYVALVSLYSWLYLCQPPLSVNFTDSLRDLGEAVGWPANHTPKVTPVSIQKQDCMLRCPEATISAIQQQAADAKDKNDDLAKMRNYMHDRLNDGYTLVRHRFASGERSVAFNRSPFTPVLVQPPAKGSTWPGSSNNGQDYLILDRYLQVMDVTYSSAWQLGKVLAMSDMHFITAVGNLRSILHTTGSAAGDSAINQNVNQISFPSKTSVLTSVTSKSQAMSKLSRVEEHTLTPTLQGRWSQARGSHSPFNGPARIPQHPTWQSAYKSAVKSKLQRLAGPATVAQSSSSSPSPPPPPPPPQSSTSSSPDWDLIHNWILDKAFYFDSIPFHYLITDPSHLPQESIRFFHIDPNWIDCFIDGALSTANHLSRDDDTIRVEIKSQLNTYLSTKDANGQFPQMPVYGFFLRSAIVKIFPDIHIDVPFPTASSPRAPILLQRTIREDTIIVLLDRTPDGGEIGYLRISQPPHQQRFSAGDFLDDTKLEFLFREVYPWEESPAGSNMWIENPQDLETFREPYTFENPTNRPPPTTPSPSYDPLTPVFNWTSRCLSTSKLGDFLFAENSDMKTKWTGHGEWNSGILAIELNDTLKYLEFKPPGPPTITLATPRHQIYITDAELQSLNNSTQDSNSKADASNLADSIQPVSNPVIGQAIQPPSGIALRSIPEANVTVNSPDHAIDGLSTTRGTVQVNRNALATAVQFRYKVFPSTTKYKLLNGQNTGFVNTTCTYPPDLIFSITRNQRTPGLFLHQIDFKIPYGGPEQRPKGAPASAGLLPNTNSFIGSARMLSDQRFVVHTNQIPGYIVVSVIPRSMNLSVPMDTGNDPNLIDISFKLNEVEITGDDGTHTDTGDVRIDVTESYGAWVKDDNGSGRKWSLQNRGGGVMTAIHVQRRQTDMW